MIDEIKRAWNSFILLFTFKEEIEYAADGGLENLLTNREELPEELVDHIKRLSEVATDKRTKRAAMKKRVFDSDEKINKIGLAESINKEYEDITSNPPEDSSDMSDEERLEQALSNIEKNSEITKKRLRNKIVDGLKELSNAELIQKWSLEDNCLELLFMDGNELTLTFEGKLIESKADVNRTYVLQHMRLDS